MSIQRDHLRWSLDSYIDHYGARIGEVISKMEIVEIKLIMQRLDAERMISLLFPKALSWTHVGGKTSLSLVAIE